MPFNFRLTLCAPENTQCNALPQSVPEGFVPVGARPASGAIRAPGLPLKWLISCVLALTATGVQADQAGSEPALSAQRKAALVKIFGEALRDKEITQAQYEQSISWVHASPCHGVDHSLSGARQARLETAVAKEEQAGKNAKVLKSFSLQGWFILQTLPMDAELGYLFYAQDPIKGRRPVTTWGGAVPVIETTEVAQWAKQNAPGIPARLAECFAWHVTLNQE